MIVSAFYSFREEKWKNCNYHDLMGMLEATCKKYGLPFKCISDSQQAEFDTFITPLPANLMKATLIGQWEFLKATPGPHIMTGADCLLCRDPRPLFDDDFDIAVTSPKVTEDKINTGLVLVKDGPTAAPVWEEAINLGPNKWGDDQTMLWRAIKASSLKVLRLDGNIHNRPVTENEKPETVPTIAHFKGQRKGQMRPWFNKFAGC